MSRSQRNSLRTSYEKKAEARDRKQISPWKQKERQSFLDLLNAEGCHTLLELGSGPGRDGLFFQKNGLDVTCTDLTPEMIKHCRQKGLKAQVVDMADLPFAPASFDAVYAMNSLLHLRKRELPTALYGIRRVLVKNGLFYMGVWGGWNFEGILEDDSYRPKRFFSFFDDDLLQETLSDWFDIVSFKSMPIPHSGKDYQYQSLIARTP